MVSRIPMSMSREREVKGAKSMRSKGGRETGERHPAAAGGAKSAKGSRNCGRRKETVKGERRREKKYLKADC